jgi:hypothetical protein
LPVVPISNSVAPLPVQDTLEVAKAKADHAAAKFGVVPVTPVLKGKGRSGVWVGWLN